jgi:hypothetical protein
LAAGVSLEIKWQGVKLTTLHIMQRSGINVHKKLTKFQNCPMCCFIKKPFIGKKLPKFTESVSSFCDGIAENIRTLDKKINSERDRI